MPDLNFALEAPLSAEQLAFLGDSLRASFDIENVQASEKNLTVAHHESASADVVRSMTKRFLFISKSLNKDLLFHNDVPIQYELDPQPHLEKTRDVIPVHPGFFTLQGDFLRVFHAINRAIRKMATDLEAIEQEYPAVWPVRLFKAIDYFHEFPQQVILCSAVKDDYAARDEFSKRYAKSAEFDSIEMGELMADAEYGLEPAVCDCCYYGLEGATALKNAYYTCYNKVFRNERSPSGQLDRLTNFSVRDIMFVGDEEFVLESRQRLIELLSRFLTDLQLHAKIETANDPFFANDSAMKSVFQNSHRLKYELLAKIPHLKKDVAIGSINFHMDFFGKAFDIHLPDEMPAFSGCIGIGMERTAYALFCQHGSQISGWPTEVRQHLELNSAA